MKKHNRQPTAFSKKFAIKSLHHIKNLIVLQPQNQNNKKAYQMQKLEMSWIVRQNCLILCFDIKVKKLDVIAMAATASMQLIKHSNERCRLDERITRSFSGC